jgi:GMP synthase (glutamine-hydrolysing)
MSAIRIRILDGLRRFLFLCGERVNPKILLLQARRADDPMASHEHVCFVDGCGLPAENVVPSDLCSGPPSLARLRGYDALMVGGSGDYYVSEANLPHFAGLLELLRDVVEVGLPMFASCFGYQSLVEALGGEIVFDPANTEVGTFELKLTEEGRSDELFGGLPPKFDAQMGHKDRAVSHPEGIPNLASSEASPFQALRVPNKPIWASQFHPELDRRANEDRYRHYLEGYASHMTAEEREAAFERFRESPQASGLLRRFIELVF